MRVYLAGPDCFRENSLGIYARKKDLCKAYGLEGMAPLDNELDDGDNLFFEAAHIRKGNIEMIHKADIIIAEISPFRGPGMDAGTAFEIGYAQALSKKVIMYSNESQSRYKDRVNDWHNLSGIEYRTSFVEFPSVEDFQLTDNLMIALCEDDMMPVFSTFHEAVLALALRLEKNRDVQAAG